MWRHEKGMTMHPKLTLLLAGTFAASLPVLLAADPDGKQLYATHCASCHGTTGQGDGPAAVYVYPRPRDFSRGMFKVRSTPDGQMPTDEDLFNSITRGMPGSSMPGFGFLTEAERKALVEQIKSLVQRKQSTPPTPIQVGEEPPVTAQTIAEGKQLYAKMQCAKCHGEAGKGDGPSAAQLVDSWGFPIKVRDFTTGQYIGGPDDKDLYLRFTTGMSGTPMPSYQDSMNDEERWKLVHYVQSLRVKNGHHGQEEAAVEPKDHTIPVARVTTKIGVDPTDKLWNNAPAHRIPMTMLWPSPHPLQNIHVRALHDGKQMAVLLEWPMELPSYAVVRAQDFTDAAALQFSLKGTTPFVGMGDKDNPVNIWQWKASWQKTVEGQRPDVNTQYASMHVDMYQETKPLFKTALAAGNIVAAETRKTPIEDLNAAGFGTLTAQPADDQNVAGKGVWMDGKWRVVFLRDLKTGQAGDQQFTTGGAAPVAFAVWSGQHNDRNGQKAVSTWYWLKLEK